MHLLAVKTDEKWDSKGRIWFKNWDLQDADTKKVYGVMAFNSAWTDGKRYSVVIYSPIHWELGSVACEMFGTVEPALAWARQRIEALSEPTVEELQAAVESIRASRYRDEMSDDFAYSNGKIARWNRLERLVLNKIEILTQT